MYSHVRVFLTCTLLMPGGPYTTGDEGRLSDTLSLMRVPLGRERHLGEGRRHSATGRSQPGLPYHVKHPWKQRTHTASSATRPPGNLPFQPKTAAASPWQPRWEEERRGRVTCAPETSGFQSWLPVVSLLTRGGCGGDAVEAWARRAGPSCPRPPVRDASAAPRRLRWLGLSGRCAGRSGFRRPLPCALFRLWVRPGPLGDDSPGHPGQPQSALGRKEPDVRCAVRAHDARGPRGGAFSRRRRWPAPGPEQRWGVRGPAGRVGRRTPEARAGPA